MPSTRRFPPPWQIDEANDAYFIVRGIGDAEPLLPNHGQLCRGGANRLEPNRRLATALKFLIIVVGVAAIIRHGLP
jgi:hypothetical protein